MKYRTILARLAVIGMAGTTAVLLAGPAQAGVAGGYGHTISGNEYIVGAVHGKAALANTPTFPLTWKGLVNQHSLFTVPGGQGQKGSSATLPSRLGGLELTLTSNFSFKVLYLNRHSCYAVGETYASLTVDGKTGTGLFWGASGNGSVTIIFGGFLPRYKNGACNLYGQTTNPRGAFEVIKIKITPLTVRVHRHRHHH
jgi:hypothetical protein